MHKLTETVVLKSMTDIDLQALNGQAIEYQLTECDLDWIAWLPPTKYEISDFMQSRIVNDKLVIAYYDHVDLVNALQNDDPTSTIPFAAHINLDSGLHKLLLNLCFGVNP